MATNTLSRNTGKYASKLHGKRILVFGGTSGIGFCVAEACIEAGGTVIISGSRQPKIDKTIERIKSSYPGCDNQIYGHACDLLDEKALEQNLEALFKFASKDGKEKIDHVTFSAGDSFSLTPFAETTIESIHKMGIVRFYAAIMMAKVAQKYMNVSPQSSLTMTGGANSTKPGSNWTVLAGWGSGVEGLCRGLAADLKPIRVNCVAPGAVHTELFDSFSQGQLEGMLDHYRKKTTTGTVGRPEDVAESYLYCMKDRFVTGTVLHSNGGMFVA